MFMYKCTSGQILCCGNCCWLAVMLCYYLCCLLYFELFLYQHKDNAEILQ